MTDRLKGVTVIFKKDIREDDAEVLISAIQMIKGVKKVVPSINSTDDIINRARVREDIKAKLYNLIREID